MGKRRALILKLVGFPYLKTMKTTKEILLKQKLAKAGLTLATLCDLVLGEDSLARSDEALIREVAKLARPRYIARLEHHHRHGVDVYLMRTDKGSRRGLPEITNEFMKQIGCLDPELEREDEWAEWLPVLELAHLQVI